ncbi:MAG: hypothetical protein OXD45_03100 [Rhodobacteraceae bacterium]|nr:hypothetical protein [Paracoccaceae bacterium]
MTGEKFLVAAFALLGATIGAVHALTVSPLSTAVLELVGAIFLSVFSGLAYLKTARTQPSDASAFKEITLRVGMVIIVLLVSYWVFWGGVKTYHYSKSGVPPQFVEVLPKLLHAEAMLVLFALDERGIRREESVPFIVSLAKSYNTKAIFSDETNSLATSVLTMLVNKCDIKEFEDLKNTARFLHLNPQKTTLNQFRQDKVVTDFRVAVIKLGSSSVRDLVSLKECNLDPLQLSEIEKYDNTSIQTNHQSLRDALIHFNGSMEGNRPEHFRNESGSK